jgi:uncharacterized membrane protein
LRYSVRVPAACPAIAIAMLIILELACSRPNDRASLAGSTRAYRCEDGYRFVARFEPERVWLFVGDQTLSLPQIPSTSGVHFTDGRVTFREIDNQASTDASGEPHERCMNRPSAVPWEEARLRGVDFRATGQDPAWTLEIDEGSGIVFGDGQTRLTFPAARAPDNVIEVSSEGRSIRIERTPAECSDPTGERLDTFVRVLVDGREYRGCGRRLGR